MSRDDLITSNMNLVYFVIHKHYPTFVGDEDVIQSGMLGLCKAANTFDESRGEFSTFAVRCILNAIRSELRERKKFGQPLSLDYEVNLGDGEKVKFGDTIAGEEDVDYPDVDWLRDRLTDTEMAIWDLRSKGKGVNEIVRTLGCNRQSVWYACRKVKALLGGNNGDKS